MIGVITCVIADVSFPGDALVTQPQPLCGWIRARLYRSPPESL